MKYVGRGETNSTQQTLRLSRPPHTHTHFLSWSFYLSSGHLSVTVVPLWSSRTSCHPQMNSLNSVSSSEDIKPPPGLQNMGNINYQCTSPGGMSKHICAICGDRSSGNMLEKEGQSNQHHQKLKITDHTHSARVMWDNVMVCLFFQESTTAFTAVKDAKASSRGPSAKI